MIRSVSFLLLRAARLLYSREQRPMAAARGLTATILLYIAGGLWGQALPDLSVTAIDKTSFVTDSQSLTTTGTLGVTVSNLSSAAVTVAFRIIAWEDRNNNGTYEAATDNLLGSLLYSNGVPSGGAAAIRIPLSGTVLFRGNLVYVTADSSNVITETNKANNTSNTGVNSRVGPSDKTFNPRLKFSWTSSSTLPGYIDVISTPAVVDLNGDGIADIIFSSGTSTLNFVSEGYLRAISGKDGTELFTVSQTTPIDLRVNALSSFAVGDIDSDGHPEIIAVDISGSHLICFNHDGTFRWRSPALNLINWGGPSLVDIDHDGKPEILIGNQLLNSDGTIRWSGTGGSGGVPLYGPLSHAADIDLDGEVEVIAGNTVYSSTGRVKYSNPSLPDGLTAVGNFDSDSKAEIVLVANGSVWLLNYDLSVRWGPVALPGGGNGGPPNIADFDGSGKAQIGVAGGSRYTVFGPDGSVKWSAQIQDRSSSVAGASVFDFFGTGEKAIIYGDETTLWVFSGKDGSVLFQTPKSSGTAYELPVIADLDGDGHADLIAVANTNGNFGPQKGLFVYTSDNWVGTRRIWNQHTYHITNVNDDGTIPRYEQLNWLSPGLNNFRMSTFTQASQATALPDLTPSYIRKNDSTFPSSVQLTARIGNGGAAVPSFTCPATAPSGLALTAAGLARGFCLSVFADRFPNASAVGPIGIVFPNSGGVMVSDLPGAVRVFPTAADAQHADGITPAQSFGGANATGLEKLGGKIYMAQQFNGSVVQLNDNGTFNQTIAAVPAATGLAGNPSTGHLFVSNGSTGIFEVDPIAKSAVLFRSGDFDGIAMSSDGNVLYAANRGGQQIEGFATTTGTLVFSSGAIAGNIDGMALGNGGLSGKLYVNTNSGTVVEVDMLTKVQTLIASGGSRGDFVRVAPDGTLLLTQTDSIYRLIPPSGSGFGSGGPVTVSIYRGDPAAGGTLIGTTTTSSTLAPGQYEDVSVTWNNPSAGLHPIVVVVDPNNVIAEGDETNNKAGANILLGVGPFPLVDNLLARFKDKAIDLTWTPVTGATGYNLYRRFGAGSLQLIQSNLSASRYSDSNLTNGTTYYYLVRWVNSSGKESGDGTEASAIPTPEQRTASTPPTILSNPLTRARALSSYSYQVTAVDPDPGEVLSYSIVTGPVGMTISATGLVSWTPSLTQFGYTNVTVRAQDSTARAATQTFHLFTEVEIISTPPTIISKPITSGASGETYSYRVVATDPDAGDLLTYSLVAAPSGMSINPATGLISWLPTRAQVTTHSVTVKVADLSGLSAQQSYSLAIARGNTAPKFTSAPLTITRAGSTYRYQPSAMDPENDPLTFSLVSVTPAATLTVASTTGAVVWTVPGTAAGTTLDVTLRVTDDGGLAATQAFRINITAANLPPVFTSSAITSAAANVLYSYRAVATDPNLPDDALTYSLIAQPAGMRINANSGLVEWVPTAAFANTTQNVTVVVKDLDGLTATQAYSIKVSPPDLTLPSVSLLAPANGAILTADTPVIGTATDDNLRLWRLEYRNVDASSWLTLATGTTNVTAAQLAVFPATLLANDVYRMRLYAEDSSGSVTTPEIEVTVNTQQLKMGDFTLSYEDLRVPGFTFPVSILRKYDTKRPQAGDFGPGWTLGFSDVDVRIDVNKNVFLTLPDGRRVGFNYTPNCLSVLFGACLFNVYDTAYTGQSGVYDTLVSLDCPQTIAGICGFSPFAPTDWLLTTKGGVKYTIKSGKVTRMEDRVGNWIEISSKGVTTNFGRDVTFVRDGSGRITQIIEPGGSGSLRYEYDAQGRLVRFLNQSSQPTNFAYGVAAYPHYITGITDALGRTVLRNVFSPEGRLVAQCDANGNITTLAGCKQFNLQPGTRTFTAINSRGFRTDLIFDDRGNTTNERRFLDATNYLDTVRTYDANNNTLTIRDPEGNLRFYTYDSRGNRLTDRESAGRTTSYSYDANCDKLASATDPVGNTTIYTLDSQCNLRFVRDPLGMVTEYQYNISGQRSQMIDPNGTTWTWNYARNGLQQSIVDSFGKATETSFDNKGNLLSRIDRIGRKVDYQYDAADRLTQEKWDTGRTMNFVYDDVGSLISATDPDSSLTMTYDNLGRMLSVDNLGTPSAPHVVVTYSYDANGNVTRVQDSLGGSTDYIYDALDRLSRVTQSGIGVQPKRLDISYTAANVIAQLKRYSDLSGNQGVANTNYEYDCGGCAKRLTAIRHRKAADNTVIHDMTFARDSRGNITSSTDAEGAHSFAYDPAGRLTLATHPLGGFQPNESYNYDGAGNRLASQLSSSYVYSWQTQGKGNRLMQDNQFDYTYNDEGNQIKRIDRASGATSEFGYDHRRRLTSVIQRSSTGSELSRSEFTYDAVDRRIRTLEGGQTAWFAYDGLNPILKLGNGGTLTSRRTFGRFVDNIIADESSNVTRWFMTDHLGTTRDLIGNNNALLNHYAYDTFGALLSQSKSSTSNDILFAGREFGTSGLGYFRARSYVAGLGRFLTEDPNRPFGYAYAAGNPLTFIDRLGEQEISEFEEESVVPTAANKGVIRSIGCFLKSAFFYITLTINAEGLPEEQILPKVEDTIECIVDPKSKF